MKYTLHEAIEIVLKEQGSKLSVRDITTEINRRKLYLRTDGAVLSTNQVSARISKYHVLFKRSDGGIELLNCVNR